MKKLTLPLLLIGLLMSMSPSSYANDQQSYGSKVGHKAANGLANVTTAFLELPKCIINATNDSNLIWGVVGGTMQGVLNMLGRIGVGLNDLVTAPIPTKPVAYPVYIWNDFDQDTTYGELFRLDN